jgi:hypothetical protein
VQVFYESKYPVYEFFIDLEYFKRFRWTYFTVTQALWKHFDQVWDGYGVDDETKRIDLTQGLTEAQVNELWEAVEKELPGTITIDTAKGIVDADDVKHVRFLAPTYYKGRRLQQALDHQKQNSQGAARKEDSK